MKSRLPKVTWVIAMVAAWGLTCPARTPKPPYRNAIGVFYFIEGGTKGGEMHFHTGSRLLRISFISPIRAYRLKEAEDFHYGAIYHVRYHQTGRTLWLDSLRFTGKFDQSVKSADESIYAYYELLAKGDYQGAYRFLSSSLQARYPYEQFKADAGRVIYHISDRWVAPNPMAAHGIPTFGTKIVRCATSRATVFVNLTRFTKGFGYISYKLGRRVGSWRIYDMIAIPEASFEAD